MKRAPFSASSEAISAAELPMPTTITARLSRSSGRLYTMLWDTGFAEVETPHEVR